MRHICYPFIPQWTLRLFPHLWVELITLLTLWCNCEDWMSKAVYTVLGYGLRTSASHSCGQRGGEIVYVFLSFPMHSYWYWNSLVQVWYFIVSKPHAGWWSHVRSQPFSVRFTGRVLVSLLQRGQNWGKEKAPGQPDISSSQWLAVSLALGESTVVDWVTSGYIHLPKGELCTPTLSMWGYKTCSG